MLAVLHPTAMNMIPEIFRLKKLKTLTYKCNLTLFLLGKASFWQPTTDLEDGLKAGGWTKTRYRE